MRRATIALAALLTLVGAPAVTAQTASNCTLVDRAPTPPGVIQARAYRVEFTGDAVTAVLLTLPDGATTRTELERLRPGLSHRMVTFGRSDGGQSTVFNLATLEPGGTLLMETWIKVSDQPTAPPLRNWYRIRCNAKAG